jgi:fumarylacetoacetase
MKIVANDPKLQSWVDVPKNSDFPIQNLPFGIFSKGKASPRVGVAIGEHILDLSVLAENGYFENIAIDDISVFYEDKLNPFVELGKETTRAVRKRVSDLLNKKNKDLQKDEKTKAKALVKMAEVKMHLPFQIGDYTDFFSSKEHATNTGTMFRDPANALLPNWKHIPVGYHGRASSIVVSGTEIIRPKGQMKAPDQTVPTFGPTKQLDIELEMGFFVGKNTKMGDSVSVKEAEDYIFGLVLFNDWSARDIQAWEYVPLGPFLGKNFASSISPWVVTLDALEPFRVAGPKQDVKVLPYLEFKGKRNFDVQLEVYLQTKEMKKPVKISSSNFKYMYWNMAQQLAHHTVNGCNIRIGDLYASGTISGPTTDSYGSMLELAWKGTKPLKLAKGVERKFLEDGDIITIKGFTEKDGLRIGLGEVTGKILGARK